MFQSTHSLRSATRNNDEGRDIDTVSIHALLAECDIYLGKHLITSNSFNPRTPCGVRQAYDYLLDKDYVVSIHALLAECDAFSYSASTSSHVSIHALLAECDGEKAQANEYVSCFNPRTPCGVRLP